MVVAFTESVQSGLFFFINNLVQYRFGLVNQTDKDKRPDFSCFDYQFGSGQLTKDFYCGKPHYAKSQRHLLKLVKNSYNQGK